MAHHRKTTNAREKENKRQTRHGRIRRWALLCTAPAPHLCGTAPVAWSPRHCCPSRHVLWWARTQCPGDHGVLSTVCRSHHPQCSLVVPSCQPPIFALPKRHDQIVSIHHHTPTFRQEPSLQAQVRSPTPAPWRTPQLCGLMYVACVWLPCLATHDVFVRGREGGAQRAGAFFPLRSFFHGHGWPGAQRWPYEWGRGPVGCGGRWHEPGVPVSGCCQRCSSGGGSGVKRWGCGGWIGTVPNPCPNKPPLTNFVGQGCSSSGSSSGGGGWIALCAWPTPPRPPPPPWTAAASALAAPPAAQ